jgi:hypothetical protein
MALPFTQAHDSLLLGRQAAPHYSPLHVRVGRHGVGHVHSAEGGGAARAVQECVEARGWLGLEKDAGCLVPCRSVCIVIVIVINVNVCLYAHESGSKIRTGIGDGCSSYVDETRPIFLLLLVDQGLDGMADSIQVGSLGWSWSRAKATRLRWPMLRMPTPFLARGVELDSIKRIKQGRREQGGLMMIDLWSSATTPQESSGEREAASASLLVGEPAGRVESSVAFVTVARNG